jgi:hypothetical protein
LTIGVIVPIAIVLGMLLSLWVFYRTDRLAVLSDSAAHATVLIQP